MQQVRIASPFTLPLVAKMFVARILLLTLSAIFNSIHPRLLLYFRKLQNGTRVAEATGKYPRSSAA